MYISTFNNHTYLMMVFEKDPSPVWISIEVKKKKKRKEKDLGAEQNRLW